MSYQVTSTNLRITQPGCPASPDDSVACKSLTLDTSDLELDGHEITFKILADGKQAEAVIKLFVKCPSTVPIAPSPLQLTSQALVFTKNTGVHDYMIQPFSTIDPRCPVISYRATFFAFGEQGSLDMFTNSQCLTTNQTTVVCRSFRFDTDDISHGTYSVNYRVMADGGGFRNAEVKITVVCSPEKFEIPNPSEFVV